MLFYYQSQALWNQAGKSIPKITEKALVFKSKNHTLSFSFSAFS